YVKFDPRLWHGKMVGPLIRAEGGLRRLRQRPQGEMLHTIQLTRVQIAVGVFFERQSQSLGIELAACGRVPARRDRAKSGDEAHVDVFWRFHILVGWALPT